MCFILWFSKDRINYRIISGFMSLSDYSMQFLYRIITGLVSVDWKNFLDWHLMPPSRLIVVLVIVSYVFRTLV